MTGTQTNTALAIQDKSSIARPSNFNPATLAEAMEFSKLIANSDLAPKDFKGKPGNVLIAIQMGAEVGLAPMQAIQNIAVINGRPSLWGDAALAVVQAHQSYEWHKERIDGEGDAKTAIFEIKRKGHDVHTAKFSVADARKAKLLGKEGPWQTYPDRMLQMRARGFGLRDKFADALRGLNIAEEAMDMPEPEPRPAMAEITERSEEDQALRAKAIELMTRLGLNEAQRETRLSKFAGKLPELITQVERAIETPATKPATSSTAAASEGTPRGRAAQDKAPDPAPKLQSSPDPLGIADDDMKPPTTNKAATKDTGGFGF